MRMIREDKVISSTTHFKGGWGVFSPLGGVLSGPPPSKHLQVGASEGVSGGSPPPVGGD